jgi:hypothetical protein
VPTVHARVARHCIMRAREYRGGNGVHVDPSGSVRAGGYHRTRWYFRTRVVDHVARRIAAYFSAGHQSEGGVGVHVRAGRQSSRRVQREQRRHCVSIGDSRRNSVCDTHRIRTPTDGGKPRSITRSVVSRSHVLLRAPGHARGAGRYLARNVHGQFDDPTAAQVNLANPHRRGAPARHRVEAIRIYRRALRAPKSRQRVDNALVQRCVAHNDFAADIRRRGTRGRTGLSALGRRRKTHHHVEWKGRARSSGGEWSVLGPFANGCGQPGSEGDRIEITVRRLPRWVTCGRRRTGSYDS